MNADEFTSRLPPFTDDALQLKPPFVFNGLSVRVFPLRARLDALQQMCDGYLNMVPGEAGRFRVAAPYVYLLVLDYGQLAEAVARIGWFAQIEVFFGVPVEWYKLVNGQWVFHDWGIVTPYIFVNDEITVPLGRTVYGFPKVLSKVIKTNSSWVSDPLAAVTLARVQTMVFPEAYAGAPLEMKTFLEIQEDPMSNFRVPLNTVSPMAPWSIASHVAEAIGGFGRDAMQLSQALRIFPFAPGMLPRILPGILPDMLARVGGASTPWGQGFVQNSLNVKQFRRSDDPAHVCYQALTNGRMTLRSFNGGGLLGENRTLLGDLSGGHTIRLYDHSSLPIVQTLGIEVHDSSPAGEIDVAEIRPVMPFWMDLDLTYETGENVAWRNHDGIWKDRTGVPFDPAQQPATETDAPAFNSTIPLAVGAIAGPFQFSGTITHVLPLLADKKTLQEYLDGYVNDLLTGPDNPIVRDDGNGSEQVRLTVWSRPALPAQAQGPPAGEFGYVYLTVSSMETVTSLTNNVGDWAKYELAFMIPVKWERQGVDGTWETAGVGLVPAFYLVDSCVAAISRQEVQGLNASTATFIRPENVWLDAGDKSGYKPNQTLLRVDVEVLPVLAQGQSTSMLPAIEIRYKDPRAGLDVTDSRDTPGEWAEVLKSELGAKKFLKEQYPEELKIGRALALELLGYEVPFSIYTLKQFRDVTDSDKACYQSLVRVPRLIKEVLSLEEMNETLVVRIFDYPTLEIVKSLGIQASRLPERAAGIVYDAQAIRPFLIRGTLNEPLGEQIMQRVGGRTWTLFSDVAFSTLLSDEKDAPLIDVDATAEELQDQNNPCAMTAIMREAAERSKRSRQNGVKSRAYSKEASRNALRIVDPQTVIESVLSREWGNTDSKAKWRSGRRELTRAFSALPLGGDVKPFAESVLYRNLNNELAERPGAVASTLSEAWDIAADLTRQIAELKARPPAENASQRWRQQMELIILAQEQFTRLSLRMEDGIEMLASLGILGFHGWQKAYTQVNKIAPTEDQIFQSGSDLVTAIRAIAAQAIEGEPSERNDLDPRISADHIRLNELLAEIPGGLDRDAALQWAMSHVDYFRQTVDLARALRAAQNEALLNKMSRAYQKPDFCVRRDSVGTERDWLFPLALSWDEDWYYGKEVEYQLPWRLRAAAGTKASPPPPDGGNVEGGNVEQSVPEGAGD